MHEKLEAPSSAGPGAVTVIPIAEYQRPLLGHTVPPKGLIEASDSLRHDPFECFSFAKLKSNSLLGSTRVASHRVTPRISSSVVREYRKKRLLVDLQIMDMTPDEQYAAFEEDRIDLGLSRELPLEMRKHLDQMVIFTDHLVAALPEGHRLLRQREIKLKQLVGESFVKFHRADFPHLSVEVTAYCRQADFTPRVVQRTGFIATVITLVESAAGVSILPGCVQTFPQQAVAFRPLIPRSDPIRYCAVWRRESISAAVATFLEVLRDHQSRIQRQISRLITPD